MEERKKKIRDLILIGMPGCGKSVIGRRLSIRMNRPLLDLDEEIERQENCTIPEIFNQRGESGFRKSETEAFRRAVCGGRILSAGGGIVTQSENLEIARQGLVIFIDRPLEKIMGDVRTDTRPLLKEGKERLHRLWTERYDLYQSWADIRVVNDGSLKEVVEKIKKEVEAYENHGD